jgi:DNA-damage-inducible protein J
LCYNNNAKQGKGEFMNTMDARVTVRTSLETKEEAKQIFETLGIDLSTAINVFLKKSITAGGFPFSVTIDKPNKITMKAIQDSVEHPERGKHYDTFEDFMEDMNAL